MDIQIINNGVEPLDLCWYPRLDVTKEVHPVMNRATKIVLGQSRPSSWTKRTEDVALTTSSIINLLRGPGCRSWRFSGGVCRPPGVAPGYGRGLNPPAHCKETRILHGGGVDAI